MTAILCKNNNRASEGCTIGYVTNTGIERQGVSRVESESWSWSRSKSKSKGTKDTLLMVIPTQPRGNPWERILLLDTTLVRGSFWSQFWGCTLRKVRSTQVPLGTA